MGALRASKMMIFLYFLLSLLDVGWAGVETLEKPFTGTKQDAWESMASGLREANEKRLKSAASASCTYNFPFLWSSPLSMEAGISIFASSYIPMFEKMSMEIRQPWFGVNRIMF